MTFFGHTHKNKMSALLNLPKKIYNPPLRNYPFEKKFKNVYELCFRLKDYGVGMKFTHDRWLENKEEFKAKPTFWTITHFQPKVHTSVLFFFYYF